MEFLGNLGIDIKLLIAQMINFILLLLILKKFLYEPVIQEIEKEEHELELARQTRQKIDEEKELWLNERNKILIQSKKMAKRIVKEAQNIANDIQDKNFEKIQATNAKLIQQTKNKLKSLKPEIKKELLKNIENELKRMFLFYFHNKTKIDTERKLQSLFWDQFIRKVRHLSLQKIAKLDFLRDLKNRQDGKIIKNKRDFQKELIKLVNKKNGPIFLEYAYPINKKQIEEIDNIISKKIGFDIKIKRKINKSLINGFSLEVFGIVVEASIVNIINDTFLKINEDIK